MSDEADAYLAKARESLDEARQIERIGLVNVAARCAYYSLFHAAEALIFERTGRVAKTHSGVRAEFSRLTRNDPSIDPSLGSLLAQAYKYKEAADYSIRSNVSVSVSEVAALMDGCLNFIAAIARLVFEAR